MSTLAEIEKAVPQFSAEELAELEQFIRKARREKERVGKPSLRDIEPMSVGRILQPLGTRDEWYDEMREGPALEKFVAAEFTDESPSRPGYAPSARRHSNPSGTK